EHYSEAAYARVQAELTAFSLSLEARETSEEYDTLFRTAKARLASIPTLLEDAKTEVSALLQSTYDSLTASSALYSEEALAELTRLAEEAKNAISAVTAVSQHGLVRELADQALAAMKAVKRDRLCNGQSDLSDVGYPAEFDHAVNGYWGTVEKADAIPSGSSLTITECPKNSEDLYNKLSVAMKRDLLLNAQGEPVSASLGRKLRKGELLLALDIRTDLPSASLPYRVTILLPNGFEQETLLGVVCFGAGGSAEFLPCTREGDQLIFETTHFSDFYLVAESDLNLLPAILLVSLLILCELIAVSWLLYRRYRRRKNEDDTEADGEPPLLPFAAVVPFSLFSYPKLLQIKPEHGGSLLIVLSGAALLLGAAIAVLIRQEAEREKRNKQNAIEKQKAAHSGKKERHALPNRHTAALPPRRADEFMMRDSTEMVTDTEALRVSAAANIALAEEETLNDELLSTAREGRPPEDLDLPQAGDAALEETDREEEERRYELNVDVLARHFSAGDCVTPELLKKMGVIPSNV
ncbi:MAG: hypothetical protein IJX13_00790, partial [Clostridia bacterium]|nr:hypothetical protein [Clostridia bacterium]